MTRRQITLFMGFSALFAAASLAEAQSAARNCGPRAQVVAHLTQNYDESRRAIGLAANNAMVEVFAATSGSWTIVVTTAGGPSCIVAAGENFQIIPESAVNTDPDA